ncbi:MAG: YitT family protein [Clostridiaceae bacterium]
MKKEFRRFFMTTIGVLVLALSIIFFTKPNRIAAGGISGIAIIVNSIFPHIPVGLLMLVMDIFLFIIAFVTLGSKFGGISIYASITLSLITWIFEKILPPGIAVTNDILLATIFGTLLSGVGLGIIFNQNASTGGTDILAKILNKFGHINIGKALLLVDLIVTIFGGITFGAELGMYALLAVIINGFVIDNVIEGLNITREVRVVSNYNEEIRNYIINELERGCTLIPIKGGYTQEERYMLYTVVGRKEFIKLREYIKATDSFAFITVNEVHEVLGEGFKNIVEE